MIDLGMYTFDSLWRHGYRMSTALQLEFCFASNNWYYAFIFQASFSMVFTFTLGLPIIWRAIRQHLSHPRRTKAKVSSSPVTTPHSLFQTLVRSLSLSFRSGNVLHLNDAMLVPKVSLSKNGIGWTTLWWSPKLCHLYSDFLCVVKDLHTHNVIAIGCRP